MDRYTEDESVSICLAQEIAYDTEHNDLPQGSLVQEECVFEYDIGIDCVATLQGLEEKME